MSAYHHDFPHGAGLIMISKAYFTHFIEKHVCDRVPFSDKKCAAI